MRKILPVVLALGLLSGACAGSRDVVTVDGVTFARDDIPIVTESSIIDLAIFRNALNWVIRDQVLTSAAREDASRGTSPAPGRGGAAGRRQPPRCSPACSRSGLPRATIAHQAGITGPGTDGGA